MSRLSLEIEGKNMVFCGRDELWTAVKDKTKVNQLMSYGPNNRIDL